MRNMIRVISPSGSRVLTSVATVRRCNFISVMKPASSRLLRRPMLPGSPEVEGVTRLLRLGRRAKGLPLRQIAKCLRIRDVMIAGGFPGCRH